MAVNPSKPEVHEMEDGLSKTVHDEQAEMEETESIWTLLAKHWRIVIYTFMANSAAFLFGYDVLVQGAIAALPMFSISYGSMFGGRLILPALWQGLWQALSAIGIMAGAAGNGFVLDKLGRKPMFAVGGIVSAIGTLICYFSVEVAELDARRGMLLAGKFVVGMSMGIMMSTGSTYVSEISPPRLRTVLLGLYPFLITVSQLMAITVVFSQVAVIDKSAVQIPFASQWAFAGFAVLASLVVPESPVHLVNKGNLAGARKALARLGMRDDVAVDQQLAVIAATSEQENTSNSENVTYGDCFKGTDARRTRIVALLNSLQQFVGISLLANSTYFFIMAGMDPTMSLAVNQAGTGASIVCTFFAWFVITKVGRRTAILATCVAAGVLYITMGIASFFTSDSRALIYIGVSLVLAACCSNLGLGTSWPIAAAETPSTRLRAKTLSLGFVMNALMTWVFSFCVPYMFNADAGNLGGKIGFVFAGFCAIGFVLTWFEIPETKDLTYSQIDDLFQRRTPTRAFKTKP